MSIDKPDKAPRTAKPGEASAIKCSRDYWTYDLRGPKSLKAERNLSHLAEWDERLTPAARKVLDFLIDWENDKHGDSLASLRHIAAHLNARAPEGMSVAVRTVRNAISCLIDSGWITRTFDGRGTSASRYVIATDILTNAGLGALPGNVSQCAAHTAHCDTITSVPDVTHTSVPDVTHTISISVPDTQHKDTLTPDALIDALIDARTGVVIDIPQATPAAEGGVLAGFELLATTYDKPGEDLIEARRQYNAISPDDSALARMVKAAASWKASAKGRRMTLASWLTYKPCPWAPAEQDNRPHASRFPSCVVTYIKPVAGGGARIKFRDEHGALQMQQLDADEFGDFKTACECDRPAVRRESDDMHEFVGVRFHKDEDGIFCGFTSRAAA